MSTNHVSTAREALMAELLKDVDALVLRIEEADKTLSGKIERATSDAAGQAFLAAKLNLKSLIDEQAGKLTDAGRDASKLITNQLNSGVAQLVAANEALERKARQFVALLAGFALVAGLIGGFIGAKLAA